MGARKSLNAEQRRLSAQLASYARWAQEENATDNGIRGQRGLTEKFEREIDERFPGLAPAERARRVECRRKEHFSRLGYLSSRARSRRAHKDDDAT